MENTFSGENASTTGKPDTAESLSNSPSKEKRSTRRTKQSITPVEAAAILTSALNYCLQAGLPVIGYNEGTALILSIDGLQYSNEQIEVVTPIALAGVTTQEVEK
jgi:hypothetical protein